MNKEAFKKDLQEVMKKHYGCEVQHDGWTCRSDFFAHTEDLDLPNNLDLAFWHFILYVRGDYDKEALAGYTYTEVKKEGK